MAVVNKAGQDWLIIRSWIDQKIATDQEALIISDEDSDIRRGRIRVLRELIGWVEPDVLPETTDPDYS